MDVHVLPVGWRTHEEVLRSIRGAVFVDEQGIPREIEWDGQDEDAQHFLAIDEAGQRIGCGRLLPSGQIGRMAVLPSHRARGVGRLILDAALTAAATKGLPSVFLHAQTSVVAFYQKAGFLIEGEEFEEAGIAHQSMVLELAIPFEPPGDVPEPQIRQAEVPAEAAASSLRHHEGEGDCIDGLQDSLGWASRTIRIYSQVLDPILFDREDVIDALSAFVRRGPPSHLQLLIDSSGAIISRGHRLLELARRLDSKIEIRTLPSDLVEDNHSCVISDEQGFFLMPDHKEYQALSNRYDPVQTSRLAERFDYLWNRSTIDPELRVLRL